MTPVYSARDSTAPANRYAMKNCRILPVHRMVLGLILLIAGSCGSGDESNADEADGAEKPASSSDETEKKAIAEVPVEDRVSVEALCSAAEKKAKEKRWSDWDGEADCLEKLQGTLQSFVEDCGETAGHHWMIGLKDCGEENDTLDEVKDCSWEWSSEAEKKYCED